MRKTKLILVVLALVATACGPGSETLRAFFDTERANAGVDEAVDSPYLDLQAWTESVRACNRANGGSDPAITFDGQTAAQNVYTTNTSALVDDEAAAQELIANISGAALTGLTQPKWDRKGIATYRCPADGLLYATAVLSDFVPTPTGRYIDRIFTEVEITVHDGLRYGTAPLCRPNGNDLLLDLYEPTIDTVAERPVMMIIHGGGFTSGDRKKFADAAMDWARRGYVAISIDYRTCPGGFVDEAEQIAAITNMVDDGMEAVRWIRANAATYDIDANRIAVAGSSAGGFIAYATALVDDPTPGGPLAAYSPQPDAVMGTGANLTAAITSPGFLTDTPPIMMFRHEFDTSAEPGEPAYEWPYSYQTCNQVHANGGVCDFFRLDGVGHATGLGPTGGQAVWYKPFFYEHLDLANAS